MRTAFIKLLLSFNLVLLLFSVSISAQDPTQEANNEITDPIFNEIKLTEDGVSAIDTLGQPWYYEWESDSFVEGDLTPSEFSGIESSDRAKNDDIEQRAINELKISPTTKTITVGYDEFVDGDLNSLGRIYVKGWVKGNVKSFTNRVVVYGTGRVDGNIEAPTIIIKDNAEVLGLSIESENPLDFEGLVETFSIDGVIVSLSFLAIVIFFSFLIVALMPKQLNRLKNCMQTYKVRTFLLGWLMLFMMPLLIVILAVTIVGIAIIPLVPMSYLAAIFIGVTIFGIMIGEKTSNKYFGGNKSTIFNALFGVLLYMSLWIIVSVLMGSPDSEMQGIGVFVLVISIIISTYPIFSGLGAAVLTRFGFKEYRSWTEEASSKEKETNNMPAPPPIPTSPMMPESPKPTAYPEPPAPPNISDGSDDLGNKD